MFGLTGSPELAKHRISVWLHAAPNDLEGKCGVPKVFKTRKDPDRLVGVLPLRAPFGARDAGNLTVELELHQVRHPIVQNITVEFKPEMAPALKDRTLGRSSGGARRRCS